VNAFAIYDPIDRVIDKSVKFICVFILSDGVEECGAKDTLESYNLYAWDPTDSRTQGHSCEYPGKFLKINYSFRG